MSLVVTVDVLTPFVWDSIEVLLRMQHMQHNV